ncbi:uncharacterized protein FA14DRAFT_63528 [Meira miltonrushii]|uniref:Uncharacterized protein n=1 Tax=Meira miltonrushii TaxID=1280837 RepID=A0A316V7I5_9BASI|nr:uncharacterized protein FA14DRAFT_63528 [Meira miltonrushii]PWN33579.1 hypothetical protein FA14DRAFT_63528 [Meira miltonrushii]
MSEHTQNQSPKVITTNLRDEDFLSEHLGQLLVRQPMSPKSPASSQHDLPTDYAKGPTSMRRHTSQTQMAKSKSRNSASSIYATLGATTPEVTSPGCDDLFNSFFSTPKPAVKQQSAETKSTTRTNPASVSMSTSFGRKQKPERRPLSRTNSDKDSSASLSSFSQQQFPPSTSRRTSESTTTQPSNESGELEQSAPETPPEGVALAPISSCDESEDDSQSNSSSIPASSSASFGFQQYGTLTAPNEEEKWQIFKEGGVIEPPEAIEVNTIARKDVQNATLLPAQRPRASLGLSSHTSRYTSMTSSRFQSYRSTLSTVPTEMDIHNEENDFLMDSRRVKGTTAQVDKADATSIAKQLAARSNSVTLVPSGDDGRSFVFVSRDTEGGDPCPVRGLRRDGYTV